MGWATDASIDVVRRYRSSPLSRWLGGEGGAVVGEQIRISAKNLGAVALADFCPRCFWLRLRLANKLPFQIFPGIFSSIDSYNKRIVHSWFDRHKAAPTWLGALGDLIGYREPPHHSKFQILDKTHGILLTGSPDGVLIRRDHSHVIVDYKTAKYTGAQDELYPMYEAQLNAYALLGEQLGLAPVKGLGLIYMEPVTDDEAAGNDRNHLEDGFSMGFRANVHPVTLDLGLIGRLMATTRKIFDRTSPPAGRSGCKECALVDALVQVART